MTQHETDILAQLAGDVRVLTGKVEEMRIACCGHLERERNCARCLNEVRAEVFGLDGQPKTGLKNRVAQIEFFADAAAAGSSWWRNNWAALVIGCAASTAGAVVVAICSHYIK